MGTFNIKRRWAYCQLVSVRVMAIDLLCSIHIEKYLFPGFFSATGIK
jgi:hypothetical protein